MKTAMLTITSALLLACKQSPPEPTTPQPAKNASGIHTAASLAWEIEYGRTWGDEEFEDTIELVSFAKSGHIYLNFGGSYPRATLSVWWPKSYVTKQGQRILSGYDGKRVRVKGRAQFYKSQPEVVIRSLDQIEPVEVSTMQAQPK